MSFLAIVHFVFFTIQEMKEICDVWFFTIKPKHLKAEHKVEQNSELKLQLKPIIVTDKKVRKQRRRSTSPKKTK